MCIEVIMVFKQVQQNKLTLIVIKFILQLNHWLFTLQYKFSQFNLDILNISKVFKSKMNHICWIVNFFTFVQNIKSFQIFTLAVTFDLFFMPFIFRHPTKNGSLSMAAFAFDKYLSFTWELCAFFGRMAILTATVNAIWSDFFA